MGRTVASGRTLKRAVVVDIWIGNLTISSDLKTDIHTELLRDRTRTYGKGPIDVGSTSEHILDSLRSCPVHPVYDFALREGSSGCIDWQKSTLAQIQFEYVEQIWYWLCDV